MGRNSISRLRLKLETRTVGVDIKARGVGLFAQVNWVFHLTRYARDRGLRPDIRLQSANYLRDNNARDWFGDHFFRREPASRPPVLGRITICDLNELRLHFDQDLSRTEANELFFTYYGFQPSLEAYVDNFCQRCGLLTQSVGVHYRGTDKTDEAPRVPYEAVEAAVRQAFDRDARLHSIFVASDEAAFIEFITERFSDKRVLYFTDTFRSNDATPLHLGAAKHGSVLGRDAVADALALSRCGTLIRTSSFLSAWSCVFNPYLNIKTLNKPLASKTWFPERVLIRDDGA